MLNFPNPPLTVGAVYTNTPQSWVWDGEKWVGNNSTTPMYLPLTGGSLSGPGNLSVGGTLSVTGATTLNALTATTVVTTGTITAGGSLSVTGNVSASNALYVNGIYWNNNGSGMHTPWNIYTDGGIIFGGLEWSSNGGWVYTGSPVHIANQLTVDSWVNSANFASGGAPGSNMGIGVGAQGGNLGTLTIFANNTQHQGSIQVSNNGGISIDNGSINISGGNGATYNNGVGRLLMYATNGQWFQQYQDGGGAHIETSTPLYINQNTGQNINIGGCSLSGGSINCPGGVIWLSGNYWQNQGWMWTNVGCSANNFQIRNSGSVIDGWGSGLQFSGGQFYFGGVTTVNGDIHNDPSFWVYSGNFVAQSDERLKTNIEKVPPNCTDLINKIEPLTYQTDYQGASARMLEDSKHWGFVAQDIERAMEEFGLPFAGVVTDAYGMKFLAYNELIAVVWAGLREFGQRLAALEGAMNVS